MSQLARAVIAFLLTVTLFAGAVGYHAHDDSTPCPVCAALPTGRRNTPLPFAAVQELLDLKRARARSGVIRQTVSKTHIAVVAVARPVNSPPRLLEEGGNRIHGPPSARWLEQALSGNSPRAPPQS